MIIYDLIKNHFSQKKGLVIYYFINLLFAYPLETYIFSVLFGDLFSKLPEIRKNSNYIFRLSIVICVLYLFTNISFRIKSHVENVQPTRNFDFVYRQR